MNMENHRIEIFQERCKKTGKVFQIAQYADKLGDTYGQKYFITELGEVAHINLFEKETVPKSFQDIDSFYQVELKKQSKHVHLSIDDAWRYFADKSLKNKYWYMGAIYYHEDCYYPGEYLVSDIIESQEIESETQEVKYTTWESLDDVTKQKCMTYLFKNPVESTHPIMSHIYDEVL